MANNPQPSGRLQATLDDMKRRLEEEREAAELLTQRLNFHREKRENRELQTAHLESRVHRSGAPLDGFSPLETELNEARKQLHQQKATTEKWIQQVTTERDAGRAKLRDAENKMRALEEKVNATQVQLAEERAAAEGLITQLMAASQGKQTQSIEPAAEMQVGASVPSIDEAVEAVRQQFAVQLQSAEEQIRNLAVERERIQAQASEAEVRSKTLDEELGVARVQLLRQQHAAEEQVRSIATEREHFQAQAIETEAQAKALEAKLDSVYHQLGEQQRCAAEQINLLTVERDQSRSRYSEVESRTQVLEQEFIAAHNQFREQREAAMQVIRQLESDREEFQTRLSHVEAESARLQDEATKARNDLRVETSKVAITKQVRNEILDAVVDIQDKGQKLLDLLQAWSSKDADISLESETPVSVSFFDRGK